MITHLQWRVKVASSFCMVCIFTMNTAFSQSASRDAFQKITITGEALSFEEILRQLTSQTKLYFIYSSNSVEPDKRVSLNVNKRPLAEVLDILGALMDLTFRKEGDYVVVKKTALDQAILPGNRASFKKLAAEHSNSKKTFPDDKHSSDARHALERKTVKIFEDMQPISIPSAILRRNLLHCPSAFSVVDTSAFKKYSLLTMTNPRPRRYAFTSIRVIANEYSGGIEIHMGIPAFYAVLNAGLMAEGYFRNGYGFGTSILIKPKFSINPIYTFATLRQKQDYIVDQKLNVVIRDGLKLTGRHHQLKFIFQYQASKRITVHTGPTFNFLKTSYNFPNPEVFLSQVVVVKNMPSSTGSPTSIAPARSGMMRYSYTYSSPPDQYTLKSWAGFEAGVSYLIKFPRR